MTPAAAIEDRIAAVHQAIEDARGKWTGISQNLGGWVNQLTGGDFGTPQAQVLGAGGIGGIAKEADKWATRGRALAPTDQAGIDRWLQDGRDLLVNLADIAQDAAPSGLAGIVAATATATAVEVKEKTVATVKAVWDAKGLIVLGLVAIAVIVVARKLPGVG